MSTRRESQVWVVLECEGCQCEVDRVTEQFWVANLRDAALEVLCDECWEKKWQGKVQR